MFNIPGLSKVKEQKDNHYTTLGIPQNASHETIRKAYRKLSLEYHPDRNPGDTGKSEKYIKINEAYKVLADDVERKNYDLLISLNSNMGIDPSMFMNLIMNPNEANAMINELANISLSKLPIGQMMGMGMGTSNIFGEHMMGANKHKSSARGHNSMNFEDDYDSKPESIFRTIPLSLLEAYTGCKVPISITRWKMEAHTKFEQTETIYIDVPKGIDNNEIITLANKGHKLAEHSKGDIEVKILINNDTQFERIGIDLIYKKSITLKQSFCGFNFELPYIDGREFQINNELGNIIPSNFRKTIPKLGMQRDGEVGNLVIIFDVVYPKKFTQEQIDGLAKLL